MAKKVMQIDVYSDGEIKVLDTVQTKKAGKDMEAGDTNWKEFHGYLKEHEAKASVAEAQLTLIVTNPCVWVKVLGTWKRICWEE